MSRGPRIAVDHFAPPGTVTVSPSALKLARQFDEHIRDGRRNEAWLTTFSWADARQVQQADTENWEDMGPGLDLGAFERDQVPPEVIHSVDGMEFAIMIGASVYEAAEQRLIDRDDAVLSKLVLR